MKKQHSRFALYHVDEVLGELDEAKGLHVAVQDHGVLLGGQHRLSEVLSV